MRTGQYLSSLLASVVICVVLFATTRGHGEEPAPGELHKIRFIGEDGDECEISFRWCPSGEMKDGDPDSAEGMPTGRIEGFWISENEVTQGDYKAIAGVGAMEAAKGYLLDKIAKPVAKNAPDEMTQNDRRAIEERNDAEKAMFADSGLPVYGIPPGDADDFCSKLSVAYERFKNSVGTRAGYSTLMFRLPAHYEWQYACRANSGKKHFADWPGNPETLAFDGFTNYREYLQKKNPDIYKRHQDLLDTFSGSETEMVRLLEDPRTENDKDLKSYIEGLLHRLLPLGAEVGVAAGEPPNVWNIRGLSGNVSEWVFVVDQPTADRANTPSSGDFAKGDVSAGYAGNWNASEVAMGSWEHFSIWQWQDNPTYSSKNQDRVRGQMTGIRIVMMDAVSETWFADLRQAAGQAFDGVVSADVVLGNFESGMEVAGRDKEGRSLAGARIRLYGALAKARAGSDAAASQMLREAVAGLKESGDEYFTQLEPLLSGDDFRN